MLKKNIKLIVGLMIGIIVPSVFVYAASSLSAESIKISKDNMSNVPQENLKSALDYLYEKANATNMITIESGVLHETQTYLGIAYLDPTDLSKKCSEADEKANRNQDGTITGVKTGCMKWYIYKDLGDSYKMILDHNTTAKIAWNSSNQNVAYESSNAYTELMKLESESGWKVTPDLISAEEVAEIVGYSGFTNPNALFYLDSKNNTTAASGQGTSKYAWLFENLGWNDSNGGCTNYGCNYTDTLNSAAYWTKTTYGEAGSGSPVWLVSRYGSLYRSNASDTANGVRPVITISKN